MIGELLAAATLAATPPGWWQRQAQCIHRHESTDWHIVNPPYAGGLQFTLATWNSAGVDARSLYDVAAASPAEQMRRAFLVWKRDGGTWREWPTTRLLCGVR